MDGFRYRSEIYTGTYLITGATGFIGSMLVRFLVHLSDDIRVVAPVRSISKARGMFTDAELGQIQLVETNLTDFDSHYFYGRIDYIIHCAAPTSSKYFVDKPVETFNTIVDGTQRLLEGFKGDSRLKSMVYLSSLEVYGDVTDKNKIIDEDYQGYVNPLSARSSYPMAKRAAESLCYMYVDEYKVPVKIARLTQICGVGIDKSDNRVFTQFCRLKAANQPIVLHTKGDSSRSYCYLSDAVNAILTILYNGVSGEAYNVANSRSYISVYDLAKAICSFPPTTDIVYLPDDSQGYAGLTYHNLSTDKLETLGWKANVELDDMIVKVVNYFKN